MIKITKIPNRPSYFVNALLSDITRYPKETIAKLVSSGSPIVIHIECEDPAVRTLKTEGFEVEWDKANWTKQDWEDYTNQTCPGCITYTYKKIPCPNPFHKPTKKKT